MFAREAQELNMCSLECLRQGSTGQVVPGITERLKLLRQSQVSELRARQNIISYREIDFQS